MAVFPPAPPVTVLVDGRPLAAYRRAYLVGGRVLAPVRPLISDLGDRLWIDSGSLVVERAGRRVRVPLFGTPPRDLDTVYVAVAPVLRGLGLWVRYEPRHGQLEVRSGTERVVASPTPYDAAAPSAPPSAVFTPEPQHTPRPVWTGSPLPRRTPLPYQPP